MIAKVIHAPVLILGVELQHDLMTWGKHLAQACDQEQEETMERRPGQSVFHIRRRNGAHRRQEEVCRALRMLDPAPIARELALAVAGSQKRARKHEDETHPGASGP